MFILSSCGKQVSVFFLEGLGEVDLIGRVWDAVIRIVYKCQQERANLRTFNQNQMTRCGRNRD